MGPDARVLDAKVIPVAIPIGSTGDLKGYVDLVTMKAMIASADFENSSSLCATIHIRPTPPVSL